MAEKYCRWTQSKNMEWSLWDTDCGETFCLEDGTPSEKMKYCCYCGKKLKEVKGNSELREFIAII